MVKSGSKWVRDSEGFKLVENNILLASELPFVIIKPLIIAVCGTDLQIVNGSRPDTAQVLGHEGVGIVVHAQSSPFFQEGQSVVFNPVNRFDASKILGHSFDGLLTEARLITSEELSWGLVIPLSYNLDPVLASLAEPVGTAVYIQEILAPFTGGKTVIFGDGPIGMINGFVSKLYGSDEVTIVGNNPSRMSYAADKILPQTEFILFEEFISNVTHYRNHFRRAIICTPKKQAHIALREAINVVSDNGVVHFISSINNDREYSEVDIGEILSVRSSNVCGNEEGPNYYCSGSADQRKIYFSGQRGTSREHILKAVKYLASKPDTFRKIFTHAIEWETAGSFIWDLAHGQLKEEVYLKGYVRTPFFDELQTTGANSSNYCPTDSGN